MRSAINWKMIDDLLDSGITRSELADLYIGGKLNRREFEYLLSEVKDVWEVEDSHEEARNGGR